MCNTCGNTVQTVRKTAGITCDRSSTIRRSHHAHHQMERGKAGVLPTFAPLLSTNFSTSIFIAFHLVRSYFSPLSTVPITITTKNKKER